MQVIASKYMNDEGELEALTNSEWAEFGMPIYTSIPVTSHFRVCYVPCVVVMPHGGMLLVTGL